MENRVKKDFSAKDYLLDTDRANIAEIKLSGRYPAEGTAENKISEMIVYVAEGKVTLNQGEEKHTLGKGDAILVKVGIPYFWEPNPEVTLAVFSTPPWTAEQHTQSPEV